MLITLTDSDDMILLGARLSRDKVFKWPDKSLVSDGYVFTSYVNTLHSTKSTLHSR